MVGLGIYHARLLRAKRLNATLRRLKHKYESKRTGASKDLMIKASWIAKSIIKRETNWTGTLYNSITVLGPIKSGDEELWKIGLKNLQMDGKSVRDYAKYVHEGYRPKPISKEMIKESSTKLGIYDGLPKYFTPDPKWASRGVKFFDIAFERVLNDGSVKEYNKIIEEILTG